MSDSNVDIKVTADTVQATGELDKLNKKMKETEDSTNGAGDSSTKLGKKLASIGGTIMKVGGIVTTGVTLPVLGLGAASIKLASNMNESLNKVEVIFQGNAASVKDWAKTTIDRFGIAEGSALNMASIFGDMGSSMGLTGEQTREMSTSLVGLAGDLSSFKNISIEESQTALQGIFTGEGEALKSLGIAMTVANLEQYALSKGSKKLYKDMSEAEKIQLRYAYIQSVSANAQGDYARTSEEFANVMRSIGERFKEAGKALGDRLLPLVTPAAIAFRDFLATLKDMSPALSDGILWFGLFLVVIGPLALVIGTIVVAIGLFMSAGATVALVVSGIVLGFVALVAGAVAIAANWDTLSAKFEEVKAVIIAFGTDAVDYVKTKFEEFKQMLEDNKSTIEVVATLLGVVFAPALIATGVEAVTQAAIIVGSFIASLITTGAEAIATGVILVVDFVGAMITTGATAVATAVTITISMIASLIEYAAKGWLAVLSTIAMSVAWVAQKVIVIAGAIAMGIYNAVLFICSAATTVATIATAAFGAVMAFVLSPIGLVIIAIMAVIYAVYLLVKNWDKAKTTALDCWENIKTGVGKAVDWIKEKVDKFKAAFTGMFKGVKLPHFSFSGSLNPLKWADEGTPKIGVSWNAEGGIFKKPTVLGGNQGVGEAGAEAIIPLSNKSAVKPFAQAVATQFIPMLPDNNTDNTDNSVGGVVINLHGIVIRDDKDINKLAKEIHQLQERNRRGRGISVV